MFDIITGLKCNGVDGIIVPILGMLLVEVAAVGTLVVYANGKSSYVFFS